MTIIVDILYVVLYREINSCVRTFDECKKYWGKNVTSSRQALYFYFRLVADILNYGLRFNWRGRVWSAARPAVPAAAARVRAERAAAAAAALKVLTFCGY